MITVLLTDGEFTGMIRSLRELKHVRIVGFCSSDLAAHISLLDKFYIAPNWDSPDYIPFLLQVIREERVNYVFPIVTNSLPKMAGLADEIYKQTGAIVVTSCPQAIEIANDKAKLFARLKEDPSTADYITDFELADTMEEVCKKATSFLSITGSCVIKPCTGENKEGFFQVVSDEAWKDSFSKGRASHLTSPAILDFAASKTALPISKLIMPYLSGQEWDVDVLVFNGRLIQATVRKNHDMFGGLSASTETVNEERLLEACRRIISVLGLNYLSCISFKEDENGNLKLLEINPRAMGSIHVSALGGNNLVKRLLSLLEQTNGNTDQTTPDLDLSFLLTPAGLRTSLFYDLLTLPTKGE